MRLQKVLFRGLSYSCNISARTALCHLQDVSLRIKLVSRLSSSSTATSNLTALSTPDQQKTSPVYDVHSINSKHVKEGFDRCYKFEAVLSQNATNNCQSKLFNNSLWSLHDGPFTHSRNVMNTFSSVSNFHSMKNSDLFNKRKLMDPSVCFTNPSNRFLAVSPKGILDASPKGIQPYLRLIRFDKPIGTYLLYWPCTWSIAMAASPGQLPDFWLLTLFGAGAFFMRGAGCIINDMWDRDFDKKVERTKLRPLTSGELSMFQGLVCLGGMLSVSLAILCQLNMFSIVLGASSMLLVILYPLAKRFTYWPQAMLGLTFNYGALLGWAAVQGSVDLSVVLPLYASCMAWTLLYDTIYAHQTLKYVVVGGNFTDNNSTQEHLKIIDLPLRDQTTHLGSSSEVHKSDSLQDKYDDMLIGVKSTALKFGDQTKYWLSGFAAVMVSSLTTTGVMCDQTWPYYAAVVFTSGHLFHQIWSVNLDNADDCAAKFRSNTRLGFIMFLGVTLGTLLKVPGGGDEKENIAT